MPISHTCRLRPTATYFCYGAEYNGKNSKLECSERWQFSRIGRVILLDSKINYTSKQIYHSDHKIGLDLVVLKRSPRRRFFVSSQSRRSKCALNDSTLMLLLKLLKLPLSLSWIFIGATPIPHSRIALLSSDWGGPLCLPRADATGS